MVNPDAHRLVGTITDREGRKLHVHTDYGDVMLTTVPDGYRLTQDIAVSLERLLWIGRRQAARLERERLEREAG